MSFQLVFSYVVVKRHFTWWTPWMNLPYDCSRFLPSRRRCFCDRVACDLLSRQRTRTNRKAQSVFLVIFQEFVGERSVVQMMARSRATEREFFCCSSTIQALTQPCILTILTHACHQKNQNCIVIVLGLVDRSDEVIVGGTTGRVVRARIVCRMLKEQRSDARDTERQERSVAAGFSRDS